MGVFNLLKRFHFCIARRLLNVRIGVRLFALMGLAAVVALVLAAAGIVGLSASKESLRSVYEDRMLPVQQLANITNLMLANRLLHQSALGAVSIGTDADKRPLLVLDKEVAAMAADGIERNIATIDSIWQTYASSALPPLERTLANRFAESRVAYINLFSSVSP